MACVLLDNVYMPTMAVNNERELYNVLEYVKELRAIDFSAYRLNTIRRRIALRLLSAGIPDYTSYQQYLKENPKEMDALIDALTIKVSHFFRTPLIFEALRSFILPELVDLHKDEGLRIWCAGCARGEEAYSLAILIMEITDKEAFPPNVLIVGTDIYRESLEDAKKAVYKTGSLLEVKKGYLDDYFIREKDFYRLKESIKSMVTFACHDITSCKPPKEGIFSDYHLILCRNVLIYLEPELQKRALRCFSDLLTDNGYLVLGEAETMPLQLMKGFQEIIPRMKIFRKG